MSFAAALALMSDPLSVGNTRVSCLLVATAAFLTIWPAIAALHLAWVIFISILEFAAKARDTRVAQESADVLDLILYQEGCDVDPINRIERATPLHLAVQLKPVEQRHYFVANLLDAGADTSCVHSFHPFCSVHDRKLFIQKASKTGTEIRLKI